MEWSEKPRRVTCFDSIVLGVERSPGASLLKETA